MAILPRNHIDFPKQSEAGAGVAVERSAVAAARTGGEAEELDVARAGREKVESQGGYTGVGAERRHRVERDVVVVALVTAL